MIELCWKWEKVIPPDICNYLVKSIKDDDWIESKVVENVVEKFARLSDVRNNYTHFLKTNHWFEGILYNHVRYANESAGWNYDIDSIQDIQISKYGKNEYYNWHRDINLVNNTNFSRKLSVVVQLNDPSEYVGGGLELEDDTDKPMGVNMLENQGDLIVFPSFIKHRAIEVTEGTRYSATGWVLGPLFK